VGEDPAALVEYAVCAEESGWDGVFPWDVLIWPAAADALGAAGDPELHRPEVYEPMVDPVITLAGIATRTERIVLGTWIIPVARRQPWQLARDLATLDRLSHGRVLLGVGLGRRAEYDLFGEEWDARRVGRRYDEALELITRFWTGERVTFHGEFFEVVDPDPEGQDLQDLIAYYREVADSPGDVFLYVDGSATTADRVARYRELGITWLASDVISPRRSTQENLEAIRRGPPPW
jgi:alkanesulfonate monooxygenase SsuD/methylene tetrahydromethanopterin reductase-like flavin-dependent oxidoreductase (luciferase family)